MAQKSYDVILVGSGSGKTAIQRVLDEDPNKEVAVVEKDELGGICLNRGCRPSKHLLYPADLVRSIEEAYEVGIDGAVREKDFRAVMERTRQNQDQAREKIKETFFARDNVDYYQGTGKFQDPHTLEVNGETISGDTFFLSTGSKPLIPPIEGIERVPYLTSKDVFDLEVLPPSVVIVGGGYIGAELGHFLSAMGSDVTIIGRNSQFVPDENPEISAVLQREMSNYLELEFGLEVTKVEQLDDGEVGLTAEEGSGEARDYQASEVLIATGRAPNNELLNPEKAGIELDERGWIEVDDELRTSQDHIWAMGDCIGGYLFKHVAEYEAEIVGENATDGPNKKVDYSSIPHALFTRPEVAAAGMSVEEASEEFGEDGVLVGFARFTDTVKGQAIEAKGAMVKIILTDDGKILGADIVGPEASILIQEIVIAMENDLDIEALASSIYVHPALSKVIKKASENKIPLKEYRAR